MPQMRKAIRLRSLENMTFFVPLSRSRPPGKSTPTVRPGGAPEGSPGQGPGKRGEPASEPRRGGGALLGPSVSRVLGSNLPHLASLPKVSLLLEAKSIGLPEIFFVSGAAGRSGGEVWGLLGLQGRTAPPRFHGELGRRGGVGGSMSNRLSFTGTS
jgi:hypothetical protein